MTDITPDELLAALGVAVLEWDDPDLRPLGTLPSVWVRRFPALSSCPLELSDELPFLAQFIDEARDLWCGPVDGARSSGIWIETDVDGREVALQGRAVRANGRSLLVLEQPGEDYDERRRILQAARERNLAHEHLNAVQRALRESERRFRTLADSAPVLIWMTDQERRFQFFNQTWRDFTGSELTADADALRFLHPEDRPLWHGTFEEAGSRRQRFHLELRLRRHDGEYRWMLVDGLPRFEPGGDFGGYVGTGIDISERKAAERTLEDSRDLLESQVLERTTALVAANARLQAELVQKEKSAEQLRSHQAALRELADALTDAEERERRRIAAGLHDEIGQTLAVAKIRLGALHASTDRETAQAVAEVRRLLEQSIAYTRSLTFELGSPVLYELGLAPALESLVESFAARHGVSSDLVREGELPALSRRQEGALFHGARELLHNVAKHAEARHVTLRLGVSGSFVELTVADDGRGTSLDPGTGPGSLGGYGLFRLRERFGHEGGNLRWESAPEKGCRATLRLPLEDGASTEESP